MMIVPATSSSLDRENLGEYQQQYNRSAKLSNMNGNNYHHQTSESNDHHNDHYRLWVKIAKMKIAKTENSQILKIAKY